MRWALGRHAVLTHLPSSAQVRAVVHVGRPPPVGARAWTRRHLVTAGAGPGVPHLVISLAGSPEGARRRAQLNFEHAILWAHSEAPAWLQVHGRYKEPTLGAVRATFYSHYEAWRRLAEEGSPAVVCEDDAYLVRGGYDVSDFPQDSITLLGGAVRTPGAWAREKAEFIDSGEFMALVASMKVGLNPIHQGFRWTNCLAYYVPAAVAPELVRLAQVEATKPRGGLRAVDIWLGKSGMARYLLFPNAFIDMDNARTQVSSPVEHRKADFYICANMRRASERMGIILPPRGCSLADFDRAVNIKRGGVN